MKDENLENYIFEFVQTITNHMCSNDHKHFVKFGKGEGRIMMYLANHDEDVTPSDLAEILNVGSGRIANALKDLEAKGFLVRVQSEKDKRKTIVKITEKGKEMDKIAKKEMRDRITNIYERLGEEDANEFLRLLKKMTDTSGKE